MKEYYLLLSVDASEGSDFIPKVKGVYRDESIARDNAVVLLCGKAAEWDIPESRVDTERLRVADEREFKVVQMSIKKFELDGIIAIDSE